MKRYLILFAFLNAINLVAQTLTPTQEKVVSDIVTHYYGHHGKNIAVNSGLKGFVFCGADTFYSPEGYHYVFQLKGDTAIRLDNTFFHGGNFMRYLFSYHNDICHLGGYGMYNTNNHLEVFDLKANRWRIQRTGGIKPGFINGVVLQKDSVLFSFFNYKSGNNIEPDVFDNHIYKLNLNTYEWEKFENINMFDNKITSALYTLNYVFAVRGNEAMLINKGNLHYILIGLDEFYFDRYGFTHEINGNIIRIGDTHKTKVDLDLLWAKYKYQALPLILEPAWYQVTQNRIILLSLLCVLIALLIFTYWKKRQAAKTNQTLELLNPLVQKIKMANKNKLDIDELDELLEIYHMEFDSRKLKRHRLLSHLEKTHPGLIQRQKDESDKRRFIYIIKKGREKSNT
jgi:hypothetical protein